jgi:hypothetical protein
MKASPIVPVKDDIARIPLQSLPPTLIEPKKGSEPFFPQVTCNVHFLIFSGLGLGRERPKGRSLSAIDLLSPSSSRLISWMRGGDMLDQLMPFCKL